jgi:hypothetical protein
VSLARSLRRNNNLHVGLEVLTAMSVNSRSIIFWSLNRRRIVVKSTNVLEKRVVSLSSYVIFVKNAYLEELLDY